MKKGFTLVELLAVIIILAIILAIAIPSITGIIRNATKNAFLSDAKMVIKAIDYKLLENDDFDVITIKKDAETDTVSSELKLSTDNYESVSVAIDEFGKTNIMIVGQNKWDGLTAYGTFNSMTVVDNADAPGSYYCAIELGNAGVGNVLSGKTFTNGDGLQTGTMPNRTGNIEASSISVDGTTLKFKPPQGYYPGDATNNITYTDADFIAENIKDGVNIFGVTGTMSSNIVISSGAHKLIPLTRVGGTEQSGSSFWSISSPVGGTAIMRTTNPIDLTSYSGISITGYRSGTCGSAEMIISPDTSGTSGLNVYLENVFTLDYHEINISELSGNYYPMIKVTGCSDTSYGAVVSMWMIW